MVSAVGSSAYGASAQCPPCAASGGSSVAASLQGRIRQDQIQLNDWTTCVSAKTPKGQAAIQKLSGEISAEKEQIATALQTRSGALSAGSAASSADPRSTKRESSLAPSAPTHPGGVDVWA